MFLVKMFLNFLSITDSNPTPSLMSVAPKFEYFFLKSMFLLLYYRTPQALTPRFVNGMSAFL